MARQQRKRSAAVNCFPAKTAESLVLLPMPKQKNFEEEVLWKKKTQWRNCLESVSKVVITFSFKKYGCKLVWIIRRVVTIFSTIMSKNVSKWIGLVSILVLLPTCWVGVYRSDWSHEYCFFIDRIVVCNIFWNFGAVYYEDGGVNSYLYSGCQHVRKSCLSDEGPRLPLLTAI